eukprot:505456-Hanusia_phi.AAC.1
METENEESVPYLSTKQDFSSLEAFYAAGDDNEIFLRKLREIQATHGAMRIVRGDGNCFYRAYMFAIYESTLGKADEARRVRETLEDYYRRMTEPDGPCGYQKDAIEMFYEEALFRISDIEKGSMTEEQLESNFCEFSCSNAIVMFARLVCSCYLQEQAELYAPFLEAEGQTVKSFVSSEVEPLDKEVEQIQIIALSQVRDPSSSPLPTSPPPHCSPLLLLPI